MKMQIPPFALLVSIEFTIGALTRLGEAADIHGRIPIGDQDFRRCVRSLNPGFRVQTDGTKARRHTSGGTHSDGADASNTTSN